MPFFTSPEWCIIGRDLQCFWQGPMMHHSGVVNNTMTLRLIIY
ncbi:hypothetical protein ECDEC7C_2339 [Escherichia coli DEC7C]|nr:hypothetical protein CV83906_3937 [Escherichia coli]EHV86700.1 hypothetical protein ECDEC7C_2339 [Escherichia coli DEC7C]EHV92126.1 hypothetical protein ECDEC7D_2382 [Escherichia coli DEC7D]EHW01678.1 hypothetical protein ECDEC7E_2202 [Escherichia coli DEC7E]